MWSQIVMAHAWAHARAWSEARPSPSPSPSTSARPTSPSLSAVAVAIVPFSLCVQGGLRLALLAVLALFAETRRGARSAGNGVLYAVSTPPQRNAADRPATNRSRPWRNAIAGASIDR